MVQIIKENRRPSFSDQLFQGAGKASTEAATEIPKFFGQKMMEEKENKALERLTGQDFSGLSPQMKKIAFEKHLGAQGAKQAEKQNAMQLGLETINEMRSLISSAGPSNFLQGLGTGETAENRSKLEALGRSLIPLVAAGVPIRNQREFEEYRKVITNPNARQAQLKGALDGLQSLFERSLEHGAIPGEKAESKKKIKFNPQHPEHKAKAQQLFSKLKDKEKVRKELEREFEF